MLLFFVILVNTGMDVGAIGGNGSYKPAELSKPSKPSRQLGETNILGVKQLKSGETHSQTFGFWA